MNLGVVYEFAGPLYREPGAWTTMNLGAVYESTRSLYNELGAKKTMNLGVVYITLLGHFGTNLKPRRP